MEVMIALVMAAQRNVTSRAADFDYRLIDRNGNARFEDGFSSLPSRKYTVKAIELVSR